MAKKKHSAASALDPKARTAMVKDILKDSLLDPATVPALTQRLNKVLAPFSIVAQESWSRYGFSCWYINQSPRNIIEFLNPFWEGNVASVGDKFDWFSVNDDGPVSFEDCKKIVDAIAAEFGTKPELGHQNPLMGGGF